MENEAMLRNTAMERDNLYKLQQIKALNLSSQAILSPRNYGTDLKRKSQSLGKTLSKST